MSMFDNDVNFEDHFEVGDRFVLTNIRYEGKITTKFGEAERTTMTIVTRDGYPKQEKFSALGVGFANMAKRAERKDFPVVVEYIVVDLPNNKTLKRLALVEVTPAAWKDGDDGPPIDITAYTPSPNEGASTPAADDIPF
jgi:hypothetical protein